MLEEIKAEVKHVMKDYYDGVPILGLKEIQCLIEKVEGYEKSIKTFLDSEPESGEDWEMYVDSSKDYLYGVLKGEW